MTATTMETIAALTDEGSWELHRDGLRTADPLGFPGYAEALTKAQNGTGSDESVICGAATVARYPIELALFDFGFFGGSMGEIAGERLALAMERAAARGVPFVLRTATGGARMQEGMRSLIQMPKVVSARLGLAEAHQPFIAILGNPTTGGVLASLAGLADITIAEAGATVGFAGPRVAERAMGKPLSDVSHRAETAMSAGLVDDVLDPSEVREQLATILMTIAPDQPRDVEVPGAADGMRDLDPWSLVEAARSPDRTLNHELVLEASDAFIPLRGDRCGSDDPALDTALVRVAGRRAVLLALDRERSPGPSAYRKAKRVLRIAERLNIPVVTLIDT
ncbi:MAG: carboxyl transferase domain-containing protein, partial [Actinomycetota bacterium]